jgi:hypothetical protein
MHYKFLRVTSNEGRCEKCGTVCPKRRVEVLPVDADGNACGEVQLWGVNCAAQARYGSKARKYQERVVVEADTAERERAYQERQKLARVAVVGQSYDFGGPATVVFCRDGLDSEGLANRLYRRTGRSLVGSYFARGPRGEVVRVDGSDAADVAFFAERGYVQVSNPVEEVLH